MYLLILPYHLTPLRLSDEGQLGTFSPTEKQQDDLSIQFACGKVGKNQSSSFLHWNPNCDK